MKNEAPKETQVAKDQFLKKYKQVILDWTKTHKQSLIEGRKNYSWDDKEPQTCLTERDQIRKSIEFSRSQNSGGIDLTTLDMIMSWGGFNKFPLRDENKVLKITRKVFDFVDENKVADAIEELLKIDDVDIARASQIIGLFDQNRFCLYNSIVGQALKSLQFDEKPVLQCPLKQPKPGDPCSEAGWAKNYQNLIWTLEVIRDYLKTEGYPFSIADIEMALYTMGK